jgi:hypothetical protein
MRLNHTTDNTIIENVIGITNFCCGKRLVLNSQHRMKGNIKTGDVA